MRALRRAGQIRPGEFRIEHRFVGRAKDLRRDGCRRRAECTIGAGGARSRASRARAAPHRGDVAGGPADRTASRRANRVVGGLRDTAAARGGCGCAVTRTGQLRTRCSCARGCVGRRDSTAARKSAIRRGRGSPRGSRPDPGTRRCLCDLRQGWRGQERGQNQSSRKKAHGDQPMFVSLPEATRRTSSRNRPGRSAWDPAMTRPTAAVGKRGDVLQTFFDLNAAINPPVSALDIPRSITRAAQAGSYSSWVR